MYFMPESPRYLILTLGEVDEGREALSQLRGSEESSAQVEAEVEEILAEKRQAEDETPPKQDRDGGVDRVNEISSKTLSSMLESLNDSSPSGLNHQALLNSCQESTPSFTTQPDISGMEGLAVQ